MWVYLEGILHIGEVFCTSGFKKKALKICWLQNYFLLFVCLLCDKTKQEKPLESSDEYSKQECSLRPQPAQVKSVTSCKGPKSTSLQGTSH